MTVETGERRRRDAPIKGPRARADIDPCPLCGYSLRGSGETRGCPECGLPLGPESLTLTGMPRGASGPAWRQAVLAGVLVLLVVQTMCCGCVVGPIEQLAGPEAAWAVYVALWVAIVAGALWLRQTRRQDGPAQDIVLTERGFAAAAWLDADRPDYGLRPWAGAAFAFTRVGPAWYRLRVGPAGRVTSQGLTIRNARLDAGVRCRDEEAHAVRQRLHRMITGHDPPPAGPVAPEGFGVPPPPLYPTPRDDTTGDP